MLDAVQLNCRYYEGLRDLYVPLRIATPCYALLRTATKGYEFNTYPYTSIFLSFTN